MAPGSVASALACVVLSAGTVAVGITTVEKHGFRNHIGQGLVRIEGLQQPPRPLSDPVVVPPDDSPEAEPQAKKAKGGECAYKKRYISDADNAILKLAAALDETHLNEEPAPPPAPTPEPNAFDDCIKKLDTWKEELLYLIALEEAALTKWSKEGWEEMQDMPDTVLEGPKFQAALCSKSCVRRIEMKAKLPKSDESVAQADAAFKEFTKALVAFRLARDNMDKGDECGTESFAPHTQLLATLRTTVDSLKVAMVGKIEAARALEPAPAPATAL